MAKSDVLYLLAPLLLGLVSILLLHLGRKNPRLWSRLQRLRSFLDGGSPREGS